MRRSPHSSSAANVSACDECVAHTLIVCFAHDRSVATNEVEDASSASTQPPQHQRLSDIVAQLITSAERTAGATIVRSTSGCGRVDVNGDNRLYEHWSPVMVTYDKERPDMREAAAGARRTDTASSKRSWPAMMRLCVACCSGAGRRCRQVRTAARSWPSRERRMRSIGCSSSALRSTPRYWRWNRCRTLRGLSPRDRRGQHPVEHLRSRGVAAPPEAYARVGDKDAIAKTARRRSAPHQERRHHPRRRGVQPSRAGAVGWIDRGANP